MAVNCIATKERIAIAEITIEIENLEPSEFRILKLRDNKLIKKS